MVAFVVVDKRWILMLILILAILVGAGKRLRESQAVQKHLHSDANDTVLCSDNGRYQHCEPRHTCEAAAANFSAHVAARAEP